MRSSIFLVSLFTLVACGTIPERVQEEEFAALSAQVQKDPHDKESRLLLGEKLAERGYSQAAIRVWQEGFALAPEDYRFLQHIADHQYAIGEEQTAVQSYERIKENASTPDPKVFYKLGWAYLHLQDPQKAQENFERYTQLMTMDSGGFLGLGVAQLHLTEKKGGENQLELAMASFRKSILLDPKAVEPKFNMALALEKKGSEELARVQYINILEDRPNFAPALENLALLYLKRNDANAAKPLLQRALVYEKNSERKRQIETKLTEIQQLSSPPSAK